MVDMYISPWNSCEWLTCFKVKKKKWIQGVSEVTLPFFLFRSRCSDSREAIKICQLRLCMSIFAYLFLARGSPSVNGAVTQNCLAIFCPWLQKPKTKWEKKVVRREFLGHNLFTLYFNCRFFFFCKLTFYVQSERYLNKDVYHVEMSVSTAMKIPWILINSTSNINLKKTTRKQISNNSRIRISSI